MSLPQTTYSDFAVGAEDDGVRAVLAAAVELAEQLDLVELVVAVGVADAVEAALELAAAC